MSLERFLDVELYCNDVPLTDTDEWRNISLDEIKRIVQAIIVRGAERIAQQAKATAPVRTGRLRDSIQTIPNPQGAGIIAMVPYAAAVDRGHITASGSFVPPNPFFTNAVAQILPEIDREIEQEINAYLRLHR